MQKKKGLEKSSDFFKVAVSLLQNHECKFALAGGVGASLYRSEQRYTGDIDFLLESKNSTESARAILTELKLNIRLVKLHELQRMPMMNKKSQPVVIAVGRTEESDIGVDFLLPDMPWFKDALIRSQHNLVDFDAFKIPCITPEDLIIGKVFAGRLKDLDDIQSILEAQNNLDFVYIASGLYNLKLKMPAEIIKQLPQKTARLFKKNLYSI